MLLRNSIWNAAGAAVPAVVAFVTIPILVSCLGTKGFGWLTLITSVIGYFGIIDINLNSGAIRFLSEAISKGDRLLQREIFWVNLIFYGILGGVVCVLLPIFSDEIVGAFGDANLDERRDLILALSIGGVGFAVSQIQSAFVSTLQAAQRYDLSARSEIIFGVIVNVLSASAAALGYGIWAIILGRVVVSFMNCVYLIFVLRGIEFPMKYVTPRREVSKSMLSFSGYSYLSKLASTMQQHADKLIVGAIGGASAVAIYTVPITLASRVLGMFSRMAAVLFPHASSMATQSRLDELKAIYLESLKKFSFLNFAACSIFIIWGDLILKSWVGAEFVDNGYFVLILMAFALFFDSLTNLPSILNDALGSPRSTGIFAVSRGVLGIVVVYIGVFSFGLIGAALGHLITSVVIGILFIRHVHNGVIPASMLDMMKNSLFALFPYFLVLSTYFLISQLFKFNGIFGILEKIIFSFALVGAMVFKLIVSRGKL